MTINITLSNVSQSGYEKGLKNERLNMFLTCTGEKNCVFVRDSHGHALIALTLNSLLATDQQEFSCTGMPVGNVCARMPVGNVDEP